MKPATPTATPAADPLALRRYDLDWLRIAAFGLLILYHVGMVFVTWDFHIKTAHPAKWVEAPMLLSNAWRLPLLFLISGAASRFLMARAGGSFAASRSARLLSPLLFGMAVVVPPQAWVDVTVNHGYARGYLAFWSHDYWRFDQALGVDVPTWNHLWFVVYLWVYTMVLAGAAARWRGRALQPAFDRLFRGWRLVVMPLAWFAAERIVLNDRFPETHALVDDWGMHLVYGFAFALGFGLAGSRTAWPTIDRVWPWAGVAALGGWAIVAWGDLIVPDGAVWSPLTLALVRVARSVELWGAILALLGFAHRYWNHDHRWRATLNEAVFPAYIAHQTVIVVVEYWLRPAHLAGATEFVILVAATAGGAALFYLLARDIAWLRPFAGLRRRASSAVRHALAPA